MLSIWISFGTTNVKKLTIAKNSSSAQINNEIKKLFDINPSKILRLRNSNGSLIPVDKRLINTTKIKAYKLEAVNQCKHLSNECKHKISKSVEVKNFQLSSSCCLKYYCFQDLENTNIAIGLLDQRLAKIEENVEKCNNNDITDTRNVITQLNYLFVFNQCLFLKVFNDAEKQLNFIEMRIAETSKYIWNGNLKKQPLWQFMQQLEGPKSIFEQKKRVYFKLIKIYVHNKFYICIEINKIFNLLR